MVRGDCREVMPLLPAAAFDACITDPPYGIGIAAWDREVPGADVWRGVLRLLKRGAWLIAFGARRTYHRLASAVEAAGFTIVDQAAWVYTTGRPPSRQHLKPAHEPILIARAPGAPMPVNIDAGRIPWRDKADRKAASRIDSLRAAGHRKPVYERSMDAYGREPFKANARGRVPATVMPTDRALGAASHVFQVPKVRDAVSHRCAKPPALLAQLVRLFVPAGGVVLDPFAGSGSVGEAARMEGRRAVMIDLGTPMGWLSARQP